MIIFRLCPVVLVRLEGTFLNILRSSTFFSVKHWERKINAGFQVGSGFFLQSESGSALFGFDPDPDFS